MSKSLCQTRRQDRALVWHSDKCYVRGNESGEVSPNTLLCSAANSAPSTTTINRAYPLVKNTRLRTLLRHMPFARGSTPTHHSRRELSKAPNIKGGGGNYGSNSCGGLTGEIPGPLHRFLGLKGAHRRLTSLLPTIPLPLGVGFRLPTLAAPSGREAATRTRTITGEVQQYAKQANSQLHP